MSGHHHAHDHDLGFEPAPAARKWLNLSIILLAGVVLFGLAVYWPTGEPENDRQLLHLDFRDATIQDVQADVCPGIVTGSPSANCRLVTAELTDGANAGQRVSVIINESDPVVPKLDQGDRVVLAFNPQAIEQFRYTFADFQRNSPLMWLFGLFVIVVVALGRWHGARAIVAMLISLVVLVAWILPSLLRGNDALQVALVGAGVIGFVALYLTNGINTHTTVALLGTFAALVVVAFVAWLFARLGNLTGVTDEAQQTLRFTATGIDLRDLVIAGSVIGALGVLDDMTVTQVSAVSELRRVDPTMTRRRLYRSAMRIGRDHVGSTINTLVLAYAGASLPLLLIYVQSSTPLLRVFGTEVIATEIIRTLAGTIGLVLSVPITTALAAVLSGAPVDVVNTDDGDYRSPTLGGAGETGTGETGTGAARWEDFAPE